MDIAIPATHYPNNQPVADGLAQILTDAQNMRAEVDRIITNATAAQTNLNAIAPADLTVDAKLGIDELGADVQQGDGGAIMPLLKKCLFLVPYANGVALATDANTGAPLTNIRIGLRAVAQAIGATADEAQQIDAAAAQLETAGNSLIGILQTVMQAHGIQP